MLRFLIGAAIGAVAGFLAGKAKRTSVSSPRATGIGIGGAPRRGVPKTSAERLATHREKYGESSLPERGSGLAKRRF